MIQAILAVVGVIALAFGIVVFVVKVSEPFQRVEDLEDAMRRQEDFHGTTD